MIEGHPLKSTVFSIKYRTLLFNQMLSEGKQKIFQARWRDENSQKLVQLEVLKGADEICRF